MINSEYFKSIIQDLVYDLEKTFPYTSALVLETSGERILVQTKQQSAELLDPSRGAVLTAFNGRSFLECATSDLSVEGLRGAAEQLKELGKDQGVFFDGPEIDPGPKMNEYFLVKPGKHPEMVSLTEKIAACTALKDDLHHRDGKIVQATAQYAHVRSRELFVNRHKVLYQDLRRTQMAAQIIMREGERSVNLHTGQALQGGYEQAFIPEDKLARMTEDCRRLLGARRLSTGCYDCLFSPDFSGIFAHEAFGHGMETDMFLKKRAKGEEYLGKPVASPLVDLFDSPALPGQAASFFFDHEGELAKETRIIEKGILQRGLTDLNSAARLKLTRSANGRRESFERKAYARMTNTYFGPGKDSCEALLASIEDGFFLDHPSNGMEDPKGWGIQLEGYYAERIKNGRLTGEIFTPVIITGYVPDLLQSISGVGDRVEISGLGMCGKGHKEWVKVTDGGPCLKLRARLA
ncbi:MAG: TldD/PmbA family protein [Deltaproteobacteria bacterium]|nr:TldD/PmbA family protein [Deltaproteobacteria bacterium]